LSTHLRLGLPSALSFWLSHKYPICIPLLPHSCYMPCHLILLDLIILIILGEENKAGNLMGKKVPRRKRDHMQHQCLQTARFNAKS
jgi:hypothetical protein